MIYQIFRAILVFFCVVKPLWLTKGKTAAFSNYRWLISRTSPEVLWSPAFGWQNTMTLKHPRITSLFGQVWQEKILDLEKSVVQWAKKRIFEKLLWPENWSRPELTPRECPNYQAFCKRSRLRKGGGGGNGWQWNHCIQSLQHVRRILSARYYRTVSEIEP